MSNYIHELYVKLQCTLLYLFWLILYNVLILVQKMLEDPAQRIIDVGKKIQVLWCQQYCDIVNFGKKNHEVNGVIKKVNNLLETLCLEHGFTFICNSPIARAML